MTTMSTTPFLKWAGGKRRLAPVIDAVLGPARATYYEPFLGSGAVFLHRQATGRNRGLSVLSDMNEALVKTFIVVQSFPQQLSAYLAQVDEATDDDWTEHYYAIRDAFNARKGYGIKEAAQFIWLNHACFNGLWRVNSNGAFNVPKGSYKRPSLPDEVTIMSVSCLLEHSRLRVVDFAEMIAQASTGDVVYCDPPYVPLGDGGFVDYAAEGFGWQDHVRLRDTCVDAANRGARVAISNHDTVEVRELYEDAGFEVQRLAVSRSIGANASTRGKVGEVLAAIGPKWPISKKA